MTEPSAPATKERLLDTAEALFAEHGYDNCSMRRITSAAGANVAAVNYHFGSKEGLLDALLARHLSPINDERISRINALTAAGEPGVAELMRAFIEPVLVRRKNAASNSFFTLIGRSMTERNPTVRTIFMRYVTPSFNALTEALHHALPDLSPAEINWRIRFSMGATGHLFCSSFETTSPFDPPGPVLPLEELTAMLIRYITAGMEAPCEP